MNLRGIDVVLGYYDANNTFHAFAGGRDCSVSLDCDMQETSNPTQGDWKYFVTKRLGWSVNMSALLTDNEMTLIDAYYKKRQLKIAFKVVKGDKYGFVGNCYVQTVSANANIGSMASFSVKFLGTGELEYKVIE